VYLEKITTFFKGHTYFTWNNTYMNLSEMGMINLFVDQKPRSNKGGVRMNDNKNQKNDSKDFLIGALVGGIIGGVTAFLLAPKSGNEFRDDISD
jgi:hypothetical protein